MRIDIGLQATRETPDFGAQICGEDALHRLGVFVRNARKAGFDAADAELRQLACDFELVVRGKTDAGRLFAVAQRGVVEANFSAAVKPLLNGIPLVERTGPNLVCPDVHALSPTVLAMGEVIPLHRAICNRPERGLGKRPVLGGTAMKFVSFRAGRAAHYGVVVGNDVVDLTPRLKHADLKALIEANAFAEAAREVKGATPDFKLEQITFDPVIADPGKIICVGLNYNEHVNETGLAKHPYPSIFT